MTGIAFELQMQAVVHAADGSVKKTLCAAVPVSSEQAQRLLEEVDHGDDRCAD